MSKEENRCAIKDVIKELITINSEIQKEIKGLSGDDTTWKQRYDLCCMIVGNVGNIAMLQKELDA